MLPPVRLTMENPGPECNNTYERAGYCNPPIARSESERICTDPYSQTQNLQVDRLSAEYYSKEQNDSKAPAKIYQQRENPRQSQTKQCRPVSREQRLSQQNQPSSGQHRKEARSVRSTEEYYPRSSITSGEQARESRQHSRQNKPDTTSIYQNSNRQHREKPHSERSNVKSKLHRNPPIEGSKFAEEVEGVEYHLHNPTSYLPPELVPSKQTEWFPHRSSPYPYRTEYHTGYWPARYQNPIAPIHSQSELNREMGRLRDDQSALASAEEAFCSWPSESHRQAARSQMSAENRRKSVTKPRQHIVVPRQAAPELIRTHIVLPVSRVSVVD